MERTMTRAFREGWNVSGAIEKLMVLWCRAMHDEITWPRRGRYHCRTCGRIYAVPWVAQRPRFDRVSVIQIRPGLEHARTA